MLTLQPRFLALLGFCIIASASPLSRPVSDTPAQTGPFSRRGSPTDGIFPVAQSGAPCPPQPTDFVALVHGPNGTGAQYHDHQSRDDGDDVDQADDRNDVHDGQDGEDVHQAEDGEDVHQVEDGEDVKHTEGAGGDDVTPESAESDSPPVASAASSAAAPEETAVHDARSNVSDLLDKMYPERRHHPHQRRESKDQVTNANTPLNKNTDITDHRHQESDGSSKTDDSVVNANSPGAQLTEHNHDENSADQPKSSTERTTPIDTVKGKVPVVHQHSSRNMHDQVINANTPLDKADNANYHRYQSKDGSSNTKDSVLSATSKILGATYHSHEEKNGDQSKPSTDHTVVLGTPKGDVPLVHQHADGTSREGQGNSGPVPNSLLEGLPIKFPSLGLPNKSPSLLGRTNPNHMNTETTGLNPGTHGETYKLSHREEPSQDTVSSITIPSEGTDAGDEDDTKDEVISVRIPVLDLDSHDHKEEGQSGN